MEQPKFSVGQQVKFSGDHDRQTGEVLSFTYDSATGIYTYQVSSKYYDMNTNAIVDGVITCKEDELVDMTGYSGDTTPVQPTNTINLNDQATAAPADDTSSTDETSSDQSATDSSTDTTDTSSDTSSDTTDTSNTDTTSDPNNDTTSQ